MTGNRWPEVERLYHEAVARPPQERETFLVHACAGDTMLRQEVESLLAQSAASGRFLGAPALAMAAQLASSPAAPTMIGRRVGVYEVRALLGAGGMGEVYRARDTKLGRDVAIKILPRGFTSDPDRLARFEREARVLATLNHPHVGGIYGFEENDGVGALVLELVEGETLGGRIARVAGSKGSGLPVKEALGIARQMADALDAAHEKGIVHRDLKPANIKITPDGVVKVLDFGLAKLEIAVAGGARAPSQSPTVTVGGTRDGIILGTAAYMSPEQARGQVVDRRTDIWAFGCVLYEMLTGRVAFAGETVSDTIAAILARAPDWTALPPDTPPAVGRLLRRCLEKGLKERVRDIGDAKIDLADAAPTDRAGASTSGEGIRRRYLWPAAALIVVAGLAAAIVFAFQRRAVQPDLPVRFVISVDGQPADDAPLPSPDGRYLAAAVTDSSGSRRMWVRPVDSDQGRWLEGTIGSGPAFWSPDSRWIGYFADGRIKKVSPAGGTPQTIADVSGVFGAATWNAAGDVIFAPINRSGLFRIRSTGGPPQQITMLDAGRTENSHRWPRFLPDGRHFVFTARCTTAANNAVYIGSLDTAETHRLTHVESQVFFTQPGDAATAALLFVREGTLFRQALQGEALTGEPVAIAENVFHATIGAQAGFAASADGRVLVVRPAGSQDLIPTWFTRDGTPAGAIAARGVREPRLSPDGSHLLFDQPDGNYGNRDVWSLNLSRGTMVRLTNNPANDLEAIWLPDGEKILFASDRAGTPALSFFTKSAADIAGDETIIEGVPDGQFDLSDASHDGRWIALAPHARPDTDIWIVPTSAERKAFAFFLSPFTEEVPRFSPDGNWMAYSSDESGRREVYVRPFSGRAAAGAGGVRVSDVGANYPVWSSRGDQLFYMSADFKVFSVATAQLSARGPVTPSLRFTACPDTQPLYEPLGGYPFDVAPDGRFLVLCRPSQVGFVVTVNDAKLR